MRISKIRDGASTTIMLSENVNKDYEPIGTSATAPFFTWLGGADNGGDPEFGTEQQLGFVWVVNENPHTGNRHRQPGTHQPRLGRHARDWDPHADRVSPAPPAITAVASTSSTPTATPASSAKTSTTPSTNACSLPTARSASIRWIGAVTLMPARRSTSSVKPRSSRNRTTNSK